MFASIITDDRCDLYTIMRTDLTTWDRVVLTYPPSDFMTAVRRAAHYQRTWDPSRARWDYRVHQCS